ncbi:MAG TPA: phosphatidate cytidylyltransferase [Patescibacteria group bacterium]|nr:phosphatidate cytidylyltransferase [Patescibacteria group bacterium]
MMTSAVKIDSSLKTRIRSALIFAPLVLLVIYIGGPAFAVMMAAGAGVGAWEWTRMVTTGQHPPRRLAHVAAALTGIGTASAGVFASPFPAFCFLISLCVLVLAYDVAKKGPKPGLMFFGLVYVGFSMILMIWLRNAHGNAQGLYHMLTLLFIVWASDCFAYFTGRTLGGPKLAPKISPKKTWSGFFGSSVGAGVVAALVACPALLDKFGVHTLGQWGYAGYFALGFVLAMFGQAGDLFISIYKRRFGIKDTGTLIPGHGGILDRIDALLLVALLFGVLAGIVGA